MPCAQPQWLFLSLLSWRGSGDTWDGQWPSNCVELLTGLAVRWGGLFIWKKSAESPWSSASPASSELLHALFARGLWVLNHPKYWVSSAWLWKKQLASTMLEHLLNSKPGGERWLCHPVNTTVIQQSPCPLCCYEPGNTGEMWAEPSIDPACPRGSSEAKWMEWSHSQSLFKCWLALCFRHPRQHEVVCSCLGTGHHRFGRG